MSVKRIKNLVKQLNEYRHAYYNQDAPLVSDAEYDRLFDELKELEEQTSFILSYSPTQTVCYHAVSELPKVMHPVPLLSLDRGQYTDITPPVCPCCGSKTRTYSRKTSDGRTVETLHCDTPQCDRQITRRFDPIAIKKAL